METSNLVTHMTLGASDTSDTSLVTKPAKPSVTSGTPYIRTEGETALSGLSHVQKRLPFTPGLESRREKCLRLLAGIRKRGKR